ncbi:MAG: hypothetical protein MK080_08155, partial [Opitutales bacterium]|nr:hypothetical protein [Opitutales bacterium]
AHTLRLRCTLKFCRVIARAIATVWTKAQVKQWLSASLYASNLNSKLVFYRSSHILRGIGKKGVTFLPFIMRDL